MMWWDENPDMRELVGSSVSRLFVSHGEEALAFDTDKGHLVYSTHADCCSETWFADIVGVTCLLGEVVTAGEAIELPSPEDGRTRQEHDSAYGVRLTTTKGTIDIVYRNSSNGYYGGWMALDNEPDILSRKWTEITADWRA